MSILENSNIPCRYFSNIPVEYKEVQCRLSNLRKLHVTLLILRVKGPNRGSSRPHAPVAGTFD